MNTNDRTFHSILNTFSRLAFAAILLIALLSGLRSTSAARAALPSPANVSRQIQPGETPDGLTAAEWDTIQQAIAAAEYHLTYHVATDTSTAPSATLRTGLSASEIPTPYYQAPNRAQGWHTVFTPDGIQVTPWVPSPSEGEGQGGGWQWGLALTGYGYGDGDLLGFGNPKGLAADKDTLTYQWDANLSEWWVNDPAGLEQGFTLRERPHAPRSTPHAPLVLEMAVTGSLTPVQSGGAILFQDETGATILTYAHLHVTDADGKTIPAQLQISNLQPPTTQYVFR